MNEWIRNYWLGPQSSTLAPGIDDLFMFIFWVSIFFFVLICGLLFWSVWKFRRRTADDVTPHITHHLGLELLWTIIPTIIVVVIFFWGFHGYMEIFTSPADALEIRVIGQKWNWQFEYPNGTVVGGNFHVPVNRPVKLIMSSNDVLHNFAISEFRVKHDVVPNRYTEMWFTPTQEGTYKVQCAVYCGTSHSGMWADLVVDNQEKFEEWLETGGLPKDAPLDKIGAITWKSNGCNTCHSLDGSRGTGPSWKGIWGQKRGEMVVDENYVRQSILQPQAYLVTGYQGVMPTYQGLLKERQIDGLIAFIKKQDFAEAIAKQ
jgi:cytochrome c oxidase subunit 2